MFSKITAAAPSARNAVTVVGVTSDGRTVPAAHAKAQEEKAAKKAAASAKAGAKAAAAASAPAAATKDA